MSTKDWVLLITAGISAFFIIKILLRFTKAPPSPYRAAPDITFVDGGKTKVTREGGKITGVFEHYDGRYIRDRGRLRKAQRGGIYDPQRGYVQFSQMSKGEQNQYLEKQNDKFENE